VSEAARVSPPFLYPSPLRGRCAAFIDRVAGFAASPGRSPPDQPRQPCTTASTGCFVVAIPVAGHTAAHNTMTSAPRSLGRGVSKLLPGARGLGGDGVVAGLGRFATGPVCPPRPVEAP